MARAYAMAIITMLLCVTMLVASRIDLGVSSSIVKMAASTAFIATAWLAGAKDSRYGILILAGLFFSWWGDYFLTSLPGNSFLAGLIAFFAAHVVYCVAYVVRGTRWPIVTTALVPVAVCGAILAFWIFPGVPADLKIPVAAYMIVISVMVALACGAMHNPGGRLILAGAILFYCSDIFVARGRFVESDMYNGLIGLPLYFGGQVLLALSTKKAADDKL